MNTDNYLGALSETDRETLARALIRKGYGARMLSFRTKVTQEAINNMRGTLQGYRVSNNSCPDGISFEKLFILWCKGEPFPIENYERIFLTQLRVNRLLTTSDTLTFRGQAVADELDVLDAYNQRMGQK